MPRMTGKTTSLRGKFKRRKSYPSLSRDPLCIHVQHLSKAIPRRKKIAYP